MKPAPKDFWQNLAYRRAYIKRAAGDRGFQRACMARAREDFVWHVDTFFWTYSIKDHPERPHRPFILWDYQEEAAKILFAAIGKHDVLIEKSRDMGVSWLNLAVDYHCWRYRSGYSCLWGSRKEEYVDKTGDPKSLFWKFDYIHNHLPGWMQAPWLHNKLHRGNQDNDATLDGESTNDDFARGDRRARIPLDEFPAVDNGHDILRASRDATKCRVFIGTPQGAAGAYYDTRKKMEATNPERILRMHWSQHPEKKRGLYRLNEDGSHTIIDQSYEFPANFQFTNVPFKRFKIRSPWFNEECNRAASEHEIAQELEIDYAGSGWRYFDVAILEAIEKRHVQEPKFVGSMSYGEFGKGPQFIEQAGGPCKIWFTPDHLGRPPQNIDAVVGNDIATGKGGDMSSNSACAVYDRRTGEKLLQFTTNSLLPHEFADYVLAICRWFDDAFLIWEENGPGGEFAKKVKESGYRNIFYREDETAFIRKKSAKPGWWSGKDTKRILLSDYFQALKSDKCLNRCAEALKECGEYVHNPDGTIVHCRSQNTEDPTATGENHGDMVIADALAVRGMADSKIVEEEEETEPPPYSFLARRLEAQRQTKAEKAGTYFDRMHR